MSAQIPQATGTRIGSMTQRGGLAAAFDGVTSQVSTACCAADLSVSGYNNTCGKDWGATVTYVVDRFVLYAPSDTAGMGAGGGTMIKLQGSNDNSAWTDLFTSGTVLATSASTLDQSTGITTTTAYRYHRINMNGNGVNDVYLAEVQFYGVARTTLTPATGTYAVTGVAAVLRVGLKYVLAAATGAYTVSGVATAVNATWQVTCATGSYALTGVALVVSEAVAGADKFKRRVTKFVLQMLRQSPPTLGE